jgi:uncharacterized SAM-binding protein YcdF (DUF218 family)
MFLVKFVRACWTVIVPLVICMVIAFALHLSGHERAAYAVGYFSPLPVVIIVVFASRKKWPGQSWWQRLNRVFSPETYPARHLAPTRTQQRRE